MTHTASMNTPEPDALDDVESLLRAQGAERRALAMETIGAYDVTWAIVTRRFAELRQAITERDWREVELQCDLLGQTMTKREARHAS